MASGHCFILAQLNQSRVLVLTVKVPASKVSKDVKITVSPPISQGRSSNEELLALRARNKVLTETLEAIKESASEEMLRRFDLVWFARYRCK